MLLDFSNFHSQVLSHPPLLATFVGARAALLEWLLLLLLLLLPLLLPLLLLLLLLLLSCWHSWYSPPRLAAWAKLFPSRSRTWS